MKHKYTAFFALTPALWLFWLLNPVQAWAQAPSLIENQVFQLAEDQPAGTEAGYVQVNNPEEVPLHFALTDAEGAPLSLEAATGRLLLTDALDYEVYSSYTLQISIYEEGNEAEALDTEAVVFEVLDVEEAPHAETPQLLALQYDGAVLSAEVFTNGLATVATIQLGTEPVLPEVAPDMLPGHESIPGSQPSALLSFVPTLEENTTYYYRVLAENSAGTYEGSVSSLQTPSVPRVSSISRLNANPTQSGPANYRVLFTEAVSGFDVSDLALELTGTVSASIAGIQSVNDREYEVRLQGIGGDGNLQLILRDDNSIRSLQADVPLGGREIGDGDFTEGEYYTVDNTPPDIVEVKYTSEDEPISWNFNIGDTPSGPESVSLHFRSANTEVVPNENHQFSGTGKTRTVTVWPGENRHGSSKITLKVMDPVGLTAEIAYELNVSPVVDGPIVSAEDVRGPEDTPLPLQLSARPADADGSEELFDIRLSQVPAGVSFNAGTSLGNGTYEFETADLPNLVLYTPTNYHGSFELKFSASSREKDDPEQTASASTSFQVRIDAANDAPAFSLSEYSLEEMEDFSGMRSLSIRPEEVPASESNQRVRYSLELPVNPVAQLEIDEESGLISITSLPNANGQVTIKVIADDGQPENSRYEQSFELNILPVNDAPAFSLSETEIVREEDFAEEVVVQVQPEPVPADEANQPVSYSLSPAGIEFADISLNAETGEVRISSLPNRSGSQEFTLTANDQQSENATFSQTFTFTVQAVNDAPLFSLSETHIVREEDFTEPVQIEVIPAEVPADEADQAITYSLEPASLALAQLEIDPLSGTLIIRSKPDAVGTAVIKVVAEDNAGASHIETLTLMVVPVNDAPAFSLSEEMIVREEDFEEEVIVRPEPAEVPQDEQGQSLNYTLSPAGVDFAKVQLDEASGHISITSVEDAFGSQEFTLTANDGQAENGSYSQTFTLVVQPVNDAPHFSLSEDEIYRQEDFTDVVTITVQPKPVPADEAGQTVRYSLDPASTTVAQLNIDAEAGTIQISALPDAHGSLEVRVLADDGQAENNIAEQTFYLNVGAVNDVPTFSLTPDPLREQEDFEGTRYVLIRYTGPANEREEPLEFILTGAEELIAYADPEPFTAGPDGEPQWRIPFTALPNKNGRELMMVRMEDESAAHIETLEIIIEAVNDPLVCAAEPLVFTEDAGERVYDLKDLATDADAGELKLAFNADDMAQLPAFLSLEDNVLKGSLQHADFGEAEEEQRFVLRYTAESAGEQNGNLPENCGGSLEIILQPVNDSPELFDLPETVTLYESESQVFNFSIDDEESPLETLELSLRAEGSIDPASFSITARDAAAGLYQLSITPQGFSAGQGRLWITLSDGQADTTALTEVQVQELFAETTNLFTPNGDGKNDRWEIPGLSGYAASQMQIYDENGKLLYQTPQYYGNEWDGTYNGRELPAGAYLYRLSLVNEPNTSPTEIKGIIHLAR